MTMAPCRSKATRHTLTMPQPLSKHAIDNHKQKKWHRQRCCVLRVVPAHSESDDYDLSTILLPSICLRSFSLEDWKASCLHLIANKNCIIHCRLTQCDMCCTMKYDCTTEINKSVFNLANYGTNEIQSLIWKLVEHLVFYVSQRFDFSPCSAREI